MAVNPRTFLLASVAILIVSSAHAQMLPDGDSMVARQWNRDIERIISTGSSYTVTAEQIDRMPVVDIRGLLNAVFPGLYISDISSNTDYTLQSQNYWSYSPQLKCWSRGFNTIITIIDDVPTPWLQVLLDPNQIESITLITEIAEKNATGPLADNAILMIRTKRGRYNTAPRTEVFAESGVAVSGKEPEWVSGAEYANLNNQARIASGYTPQYDDPAAYSKVDPFSLEFPNADYKSMMIRRLRNFSKAGVSVNGGTDIINYAVAVNGVHEDGFWKVGPVNDYNRINTSSMINARIGKWIEASASFIGTIGLWRSNRLAYTDYRAVPAIAFPLVVGTFEGDDTIEETVAEGTTMYGVSTQFGNNFYAKLMEGGFTQTRERTGVFNASIDVDLGWLAKGFHSRTYAYISNNNLLALGKSNDYLGYLWSPSTGLGEMSTSHRGAKATARGQDGSSMMQTMAAYETLSFDLDKDGHKFYSDLTFNLTDSRLSGQSLSRRQAQVSWSSNYSFKKRYAVDLSLNYAGAMRLPKKNRYRLFPSAGVAWIASNEPFLKDVPWLDLLKVRAQVGEIGFDDIYGTMYLYESRFALSSGRVAGPTSSGQWFGTETRTTKYTTVSRLGNPDLDWETRRQLDLGVEVGLFNKLKFMADFYLHRRCGIITEISAELPSARGLTETSFYDNYNENLYRGAEIGATYTDHIGDFRWTLGASAAYCDITYMKVANDYSSVPYVGTKVGSIRGYICEGKFASEEEIASSALYGTSRVGDLKYKDINSDGKIDDKDIQIIGESTPRLHYALSLNLGWKNFDFSIVGVGQGMGDVTLSNAWFWNGWGDGNYSAFVRDNLGGDYPNLTYIKSDNNFVTSTFWVRKCDYFRIKNMELGYTFRNVRFCLRGTNLLTLSGIKDVDPENMNSGVTVEPICSYYTAGVKFTF